MVSIDDNSQKTCPKCGAALNVDAIYCNCCGEKIELNTAGKCTQCGSDLANGQMFCASCGTRVGLSRAPSPSAAIENYNRNVKAKKKSPILKILVVIVGLVIAAAVITNFVKTSQINSLHEKLMEYTWTSFDEDTQLELDFSDSTINYSGYFGFLGKSNIATLDYEVISGDKIKVRGSTYKVEIDSDSVTFYPSFVNGDSFSVWIN